MSRMERLRLEGNRKAKEKTTMQQSKGLIAFLKGSPNPLRNMPGCANYDHYYGDCLTESVCKVEQSQRCAYFERAVLPTGDAEIFEKYEQHCGIEGPLHRPQLRRCECGAILKSRQRFCEKCKKRRRQKTNRENQKKYRRRQKVCA